MLRRVLRGSLIVGLSCGFVACGDDSPVAPQPTLLRVSTTVSVVDAVGRPQSDAIVELRTGPDAGATMTTDAEGKAFISTLVPASLGLTIRVSKPGFKTAEATRWVPSSTLMEPMWVSLESVDALNLAGEHLLTIEASPACTQLPQVARRRVYEATAVSAGISYFEIRLGGALFVTDRNSLAVSVTTNAARFWVGVPSLEGELLAEQLSPSSFLMFGGDATVEASQEDRVVTAPLNGLIRYCPASLNANFTCTVPPVDCYSESHRLTFSRR